MRAAVTDDGDVIGHRPNFFVADRFEHGPAVFFGHLHPSPKADRNPLILPAFLPYIPFLQPRIGELDLVAVDDFLFKQAVFIADAAAVARIPQGRERIEKTGGEASEPPVAETGIRLLLLDRFQIPAQLLQSLADRVVHAQVQQIVPEQAANEKLHRKIIHLLFPVRLIGLIRFGPLAPDVFADQISEYFVNVACRRLLHAFSQTANQLLLERSFEKFLVVEQKKFLLTFKIRGFTASVTALYDRRQACRAA